MSKHDGDLISRSALIDFLDKTVPCEELLVNQYNADWIYSFLENAPAVDAVEVDILEAWLYEIAMNNTRNRLCDACEEIISRLDGLRLFARERRADNERKTD